MSWALYKRTHAHLLNIFVLVREIGDCNKEMPEGDDEQARVLALV